MDQESELLDKLNLRETKKAASLKEMRSILEERLYRQLQVTEKAWEMLANDPLLSDAVANNAMNKMAMSLMVDSRETIIKLAKIHTLLGTDY